MDIGLFFGSFNPVHIGHLIIANHCSNRDDIDEVWLVVSPQNPLKEAKDLIHENLRLHMVELAVADHPKLRASDIEFDLPKPSYTVDTLKHLTKEYPSDLFTIIIGEDSLNSLEKWKDFKFIINNFKILVYPRIDSKKEKIHWNSQNIEILDCPIIGISSSFIRSEICQKKSISFLTPNNVATYIKKLNLYCI